MELIDRSDKYCIIGAGSSGLAAAKNLQHYSIPYDVIEKADEVGGNWYYGQPNSSVYRSTHLISSKPMTAYTDFPMPADYPDYPNHRQVLEYFKAYAHQFKLYEHIQFNTSVTKVEKADKFWDVLLDNGETRRYRGVIVANGHLWDKKLPDYPGHFDGVCLHSKDYKTPDVLRDKRVLVVGAGNSGCDIAVEAAQNAAQTFHSTRRGYYYVPKYVFGVPADQINEFSLKLGTPLPLRRLTSGLLLRMAVGNPQSYGLPKPDHKLFESHPIVNSQMLYYVGHGDILPKPDVKELQGDAVLFTDGSREQIDVIIYATGFNIAFPFLDRAHLNWQDGRPRLFLNIFHPEYDNLFVAGLIQPDSGQWGLVDYQMQLVARFIVAQTQHPEQAAIVRRLKAEAAFKNRRSPINYINSTRHYLEVEHFSYRNRLKKLLGKIRT